MTSTIQMPAACAAVLYSDYPYKALWGGRGSAKSHSIARYLVGEAYTRRKCRILCTREFQSSIVDSVHKLISDIIDELQLRLWSDVQKTSIVCTLTGSEFLFKGLKLNPTEIKGAERITHTWVEEAETVSRESWQLLMPTVFRTAGSQLLISWNPKDKHSVTNQMWRESPPGGTIGAQVNWSDNRWFPRGMEKLRRHDKRTDPDSYDWIWEGGFLSVSNATVFRNRVDVKNFDTPEGTRFLFGVDWGFSQDPTVMVRCFIKDESLFIDDEAYEVGCELDDTPALFDRVDESRRWLIKADNSRPETISFIAKRGFKIKDAAKWKGSVEDGITRMKAFRRIVVHERKCPRTAQEFRLYSYKVDKHVIGPDGLPEVLPDLVDKHNHCIDAVRYALDGYIQNKGPLVISQDLLRRI